MGPSFWSSWVLFRRSWRRFWRPRENSLWTGRALNVMHLTTSVRRLHVRSQTCNMPRQQRSFPCMHLSYVSAHCQAVPRESISRVLWSTCPSRRLRRVRRVATPTISSTAHGVINVCSVASDQRYVRHAWQMHARWSQLASWKPLRRQTLNNYTVSFASHTNNKNLRIN